MDTHEHEHSENEFIQGLKAGASVDNNENVNSVPEYSDNISVLRLPYIGRVHFVRDIQGWIQISLVAAYWAYGTVCTYFVILLPRFQDGHMSFIIPSLYGFLCIMCIASLLRACTLNPGRVPLNAETNYQDYKEWEVCQVCRRRRPLRAHHCRRCKQCVLRMDHHCPWINNCVGEANQYAFLQLLMYAVFMSGATFIINMLHIFIYPECISCDKESFFTRHSRGLMIASVTMAVLMGVATLALWCGQSILLVVTSFIVKHDGMLVFVCICLAVNMIIGGGTLFLQQSLSLAYDKTTLENMKAPPVPGQIQIKKSCLEGYDDMCGPGSRWMWFFPCRKRRTPPVMMYYDYV